MSNKKLKEAEDKILVDDIVDVVKPVVRAKRKKLTKKLMLNELMGVIEDYNYGDDKVKAADKIAAIKQICAMEGYNEPTVSRVIQEIEIEF